MCFPNVVPKIIFVIPVFKVTVNTHCLSKLQVIWTDYATHWTTYSVLCFGRFAQFFGQQLLNMVNPSFA